MSKSDIDMKERILSCIKQIRSFGKIAAKNRLSVYAACTSFYMILSFAPFLIVVISLIPYLPISQEMIISRLISILPTEYEYAAERVVVDLYQNSKRAISFSTIVIIWAAGRGILGITQGLNEIAGVHESRNFIYMRIRSAIYTLVLIAGLMVLLVVSVFGSRIMNIINLYTNVPDFINGIVAVKDFVMILVMFGLILFLFVALPNARIKIKSQFLGAFVASVAWVLFSNIFSLYITRYNGYSMYGSFAVIIIFGVWLYTGMYIMFMGAQLNEVIASRKGNKHEGQN